MSVRPQLALALLITAVTSCGGESAGSRAAPSVRDSAGVTIVENVRPGWVPDKVWHVTPEPRVAIGVLEGESDYELFRVSGAVRSRDGGIVVATSGTGELRFFDSTGVHVRTVGGEGSGPGEFRYMAALFRGPHDSLTVYDVMERRLTIFDAEGRYARDLSLASSSQVAFPTLVGVLADGAFLAQVSQRQVIGPGAPELPLGAMRDTIVAVRLSADGERTDTVGRYPGSLAEVRTLEFGGNSIRAPMTLLFTPTTVLRPFADAVVAGTSDRYELRFVGLDGQVRRIVRRAFQRVPVSEDDRDSSLARTREAMARSNMPTELMEQQLDRPAADSLPAFGTIQVDAARNIWVQRYVRPWADAPRWAVFDRDGFYLGDVASPADFRVTEIGADYVLGVMTDEMDVERVLLYGLVKP